MSSVADKVLAEGLQLPASDRRRIAREFWISVPEGSQLEFDDEFLQEMKRRDHEIDVDPAASLNYEEVMANARDAIRCLSASISEPEMISSEPSHGMSTSKSASDPGSQTRSKPW